MAEKILSFNASISGLPPVQVEQLLRLQRDILEAIVLGESREVVLADICQSVESMVPESAASIMVFDETRSMLVVQSAPSLSDNAIQQLNGLIPGAESGSCGTAVFQNQPIFVTDTRKDQRWCAFDQFVRDFNVGACWSMPIHGAAGEVVGSFALSSFEKRQPSRFQIHVLETSASLVALVLKRQREEHELHHAAYHDALTNLPNRKLFMLQFEHAINRAKRESTRLALFFIDLDHFKDINDTCGHETGDEVLKKVSQSLQEPARKVDLLARFGGDEFVMLIEEVMDNRHVGLVAEKLLEALGHPMLIGGKSYSISASIGISLYPDDAGTMQVLLQRADTAMYEAKAKGRNRYCFHEPALTALLDKRVEMESALRTSLKDNDFFLHYQPIYRADDARLDTVEVLVRWQHPEQGVVAPDTFIPITEDTGLIVPLGIWILEAACMQCVDWWGKGISKFRLAVNISLKQLDCGCADVLERILKDTSFPAALLEIEVTESMVMDVRGAAIVELNKIRSLGVNITMDGFGVGHSSLAQLKHLPISKLKIDRSFISELPDSSNDRAIAKTIIAMGHSLGLDVVGEGVETSAQKQFLVSEGCDLLQGFLCSEPLSPQAFETMFARD